MGREKFFSLFIQRPVATTLLAFALVLSGALAYFLLPVSPLPQVDYPVITVTGKLPGADPETVASALATPLEKALSRVSGVNEMTSTSSLGSTRIVLEFDLDRDINGAARDVQGAINAAQSLMPSGMPSRPTYKKSNPSDAPIMILTLTSDTYSQGALYDIADTHLAQKLSQIIGVGEVTLGGSSLPAVRVDLNPFKLMQQGVSLDAVREAIADANPLRPLGSLETTRAHWQVMDNDAKKKAVDYRPVIVHTDSGNVVRLTDVAQVSDGVEDVRNKGMSGGTPAILIMIHRSPNANIIDTVDRIRTQLPQFASSLPASIHLTVAQDRTPTIRASLREVTHALLISVALVVVVAYFFLHSWRATLIPATVIPVALIGTFSAMYLCGFSLNNLSLMALTVATGFVVDDAIVVLENIVRHTEKGLSPKMAAFKGVTEVGFTVLAISISLIAVFIPLLLMGGLPGRLFWEFAVTLSVAIAISLVVSLTLTPMMCAYVLPVVSEQHSRRPLMERLWGPVQSAYVTSLAFALRHAYWVMMALLLVVVLNILCYRTIPKTFFPEQDTGRIVGMIQADQSISFQAMQGKLKDFMVLVKQDPDVDSVTGFTGGSRTNTGSLFISLKPLTVRHHSVLEVITSLRSRLANEAGARLFLMPVQDVKMGGRQAGALYQYTLLSDDLETLHHWAPKVQNALAQLPALTDVNSDLQDQGADLGLIYDRDAMGRLGITVEAANSLLDNAFGQRQISTIYQAQNQYKVVMEVAPQFAQDRGILDKLFIINNKNQSIPLSEFAHWQAANTPLAVNHQGLSAAVTFAFNLPPGGTLSQATRQIDNAVERLNMPTAIHGSYAGTAKLFQSLLTTQLWLILAAIVTMYLVMGILYENFIHPFTILTTLPSAGLGALLALQATNTPFSLVALISILLLIGIVKKNAIMMVDVALKLQRDKNVSPQEAISQAASLRFRPIMMTTLAAFFGAFPLALGHGDGAELRQPLGIALLGGLFGSQLLTLYTTPVIYVYFSRLEDRFKQNWYKVKIENRSHSVIEDKKQ
ncbi:efflux RND transporter permease subunit [Serratia quinivorans]|uniref:efflux RND transporter permease subunit n=1 Tax=Serratia quinivorans TaxID=137545 RepID=UPI00217C2684|nr:efflux RND transporter permease subunit [Serratia quinivorans]CAI1074833.1 Multidrug transporter MdtC [Serratia quinivorans]